MTQNIYDRVEANMNHLAEKEVWWAHGATAEQIQAAQNGELDLPMGIGRTVPREWVGDLTGKKVLCLAGAGGLQAPLLAAAGAEVTVLDLSEKMLEKDRLMAARYGLHIEIEHGNMTDLSRFEDESFDCVFNPASLFYVPSVLPVFRECGRVLKKGGSLFLAAPNPINYVCDYVPEGGYYKAVNRMPYAASEHADQGDWVEFGHTLEDYLGGQIACGLMITGFIEDQHEDITELFFISRAIKI